MDDLCITDYVSPFNSTLLRGKVAFITGGGSGIGFTITEIFMRHGCDTVIASRDFAKLQTAADKLSQASGRKCLPIAVDVRKPNEVLSAINQTLKEFGKLDIVVNSAAGNFLCPLSGMSFNAFRTVMEIDAFGVFNVSKAAYDAYLKEHGGVILNISATLHYIGQVLQGHAGTAKAAIDALTRHMATEWGPDGIRVVGIAPGPIVNTVGFDKLSGEAALNVKNDIPLQRVGRRLDIAHAALFLVAETASYVTGHTMVVDGGHWLTATNGLSRLQDVMAASSRSSSGVGSSCKL